MTAQQKTVRSAAVREQFQLKEIRLRAEQRENDRLAVGEDGALETIAQVIFIDPNGNSAKT